MKSPQLALVISTSLCSLTGQVLERPGEPPIIRIEDADPEMDAAIAEARRRFPEFRSVLAAGEAQSGYVKRPFTEGEVTEHLWVEVVGFENDTVVGTIANEPDRLREVANGDKVAFGTEEITDWVHYDAEGVPYGQFSVPLLGVRAVLAGAADARPSYLVVGDVVPAVQRLLARESVQGVLRDAPADLLGGVPVQGLGALLAVYASQIPIRIELEAAPTFWTDLGITTRLGLAFTSATRMREAEPEVRAEIGETLRAALAALHGVGGFDARLRVLARDQRTAESWFEQIIGLVDAPPPGFVLEADGERVQGRLVIAGTHFGTRVVDTLRDMGLPDEVAERHGSVADTVELSLVVTLDGDALVLEIGNAPPPFAAEAAELADDQILDASYDVRTMLAHARAAIDALNRVYGDLYYEAPEFTARMDEFETGLDETREAGRLSLAETDRGFVLNEQYEASEYEIDSITTEQLWIAVPEDASLALLSGEDPLDFLVNRGLGDLVFELQYATEVYDGFASIQPMLDYLAGEESSVFHIGSVLVGRPTSDGGRGYALVGVPESQALGSEFVERIAAPVVAAITGGPKPEFGEVEVDDGVFGTRVPPEALGLAADAWPAWFVPHWFTTEDFLVVSTNPETSRLILERIDAGTMVAPDDIDDPNVLTYVWRMTGAELATMYRGVSHALRWLASEDGFSVFRRVLGESADVSDAEIRELLQDDDWIEEFALVLAGLDPALDRTIERMTDEYALDGTTMHRTMTLDLAK